MEDAAEASASSHAFSSEVTKHINGLLDPLAATRLQALKSLKLILLGPLGNRVDLLTLPHLVEEVVAKPLLRRFADPSEKCRCLSISLLSQLLGLNPQCVAVLLPYIFPVISERFPLQIISSSFASSSPEEEYKGILMEPSEEVRLLLIQFLQLLLKQAKNLIGPFASDIASILMSAAADKDPVVLVEVCSTLRFFAEVMEDRLKAISKNLICATLHALSHNRCHVRIAALQAIERLVLCGAHETIYDLTAYRDPNVIPIRDFYHPSVKTQYLALLVSDRSTTVREALLRTVTRWLLELPERREHEIRLLPEVHRSILAIMEVMVVVLDQSSKNEAISMLWILLNAHAIGVITGKPCHKRITCCLEKLSKSLGHNKSGDLIVAHVDNIIDLLLPPQLWASYSVDAIICSRLLEEESLISSATHEKLCNMMAEFSIRSKREDTIA